MIRKLLLLCLALPTTLVAQVNVTNKLKNASFESDFTGWVQSGMQTQTNTSFAKKAGNVYVERWTDRGNAVGNCGVSQTVTELPVGTYRLTVAAQNIQEDTPRASQTGAWIFANDQKTNVDVTNDYSVDVIVMDGTLKLGFQAENASGNWIAVDNFRLTQLDDAREAMRALLQECVDVARTLYADGSGKGAAALDAALKEAETLLKDGNASSEAMAEEMRKVQAAAEAFKYANADEDHPLDATSKIVNASFEDAFTGWVQNGMQTQTNADFAKKAGNVYVEKWTGRGGAVGNGSVLQTVTELPCGLYRLKAMAQNIQEDTPNVNRTGAWIVGENSRTEVGVAGEYSVTFVVVTGDATIGFVAEGAKGNWIACDNFRLEYLGAAQAQQEAEMQQRIEAAKTLLGEKMNAAVLAQLNQAISDASDATDGQYASVAAALRDAVDAAENSIKAYSELKNAIDMAKEACATGTGNGREKLQAVIDAAQALYDSDGSTNEAMAEQVEALDRAKFEYRIGNGTGTAPKVTTDPRYVRGAVEAFGRMSVSGMSASQLLEQGFCYSTSPNPTVLDNRSTSYLENNGAIYRMPMEPATIYYIRAYAITKDYAVGYGDVIKMSTLPMGRVTYTYDFGGDEAQNNRITSALDEATYYWSNYTSIQGFNVTCVYSPGTPTADCGYGGYMRMGSNMGQRCGTCMHEMNHGIGGGTINIWGGTDSSPLRTSINGDWAGEHANAALRFWENREDLIITAAYDNGHWGFRYKNGVYSHDDNYLNKYAFNGAHLEPGAWAGPSDWNGTQIVYIGNALINQGMCEDGLVPVNYWSGGFCLPSYDFEQDDEQKYYIKSESPEHGLYDAYLMEQDGNKIAWTVVEGGAAEVNDSAAWFVTFDPKTQYYMLRNAATNHVLTYSSGFKTAERTTPNASDKFHFMRGRNDVNMGDTKMRGYWIIHPENSNTPATMTAGASGLISSKPLNLYDTSTQQRWLIIAADEIQDVEEGAKEAAREEMLAYLELLRRLRDTPHTEDVEGIDETFDGQLAAFEESAKAIQKVVELQTLLADARTAAIDFLSAVTPVDPQIPFDLTFMVTNAALDSNDGWSESLTFSESCCEAFQRTFDFNQTVTGLPKGNFKLMAQAFQRPGDYMSAYNAYASGKNEVNAVIYAGVRTQKVQHIGAGASSSQIHKDAVKVGSPSVYIPNTMASAAAYFNTGRYDNEVWTTTARKNASLKIGIRATVTKDGYWTIFDNFRLYFYGSMTKDQVTDIIEIANTTAPTATPNDGVYTLTGILVRPTADLTGLPAGIYIVGGKKYMVK